MAKNNQNKSLNKGKPVYFSYARNNNAKPEWMHISDCVDIIVEKFQRENIEYRLDVRDLLTGDRISGFEKEIGHKSHTVVIVFSDRYFRSMHCMNEYMQIRQSLKNNPNKRMLCIKCGTFNLSDMQYIRELERFWTNKKAEYEAMKFHREREFSSAEKAAFENGFYISTMRELYSFFSAYNYFDASKGNWDNFVNDVVRYYQSTPSAAKSAKVAEKVSETKKPQSKAKGKTRWPLWVAAAMVLVMVLLVYGHFRAHRTPFTITSCEVAAQDGGEELRINYYAPQTRPYELYFRVFDPNGNLITNRESPVGYSFKKYISFEQGYGEVTIDGACSLLPSNVPGDYRYELYFRDRMIDSYTFEIADSNR